MGRFSPLALLEALKRGHSGVRSTEAAPWSTSRGALISCWAVTTATSPLLAAILFAFHIGKVKRLTVLTRRTSFEYVILQFAQGNSGLARRANKVKLTILLLLISSTSRVCTKRTGAPLSFDFLRLGLGNRKAPRLWQRCLLM